jgi:hypothetical protein
MEVKVQSNSMGYCSDDTRQARQSIGSGKRTHFVEFGLVRVQRENLKKTWGGGSSV